MNLYTLSVLQCNCTNAYYVDYWALQLYLSDIVDVLIRKSLYLLSLLFLKKVKYKYGKLQRSTRGVA